MEPKSIKELEEQATRLCKQRDERQQEKENAEILLKKLKAPYENRIHDIHEEMRADRNVIQAEARYELAYKRLWESVEDPSGIERNVSVASAAEIAENLLKAARAAEKVPTSQEDFKQWLNDGAPPFNFRRSWGIETRKPTAVGPFVLFSATESGGDRFYLAVAGDLRGPTFDAQGMPVTLGPSIKGWLRVTPSEHRGDTTTAQGEVDGKPFLGSLSRDYSTNPYTNTIVTDEKAGSWGHSVKKPLAQFKAMLLGDRKRRDNIVLGQDGE